MISRYLLPAFIYILAILALNGCTQEKKLFTVYSLHEVVLRAMRGDAIANDTLSQLFDLTIPVNPRYNAFLIDSFDTKFGKRVYTILLEYPNPFYNRFAIYDSSLNLLLIDRSLNGNLTLAKLDQTAEHFLSVTESFRTKDNIKLERLSLYAVKRDSALLALRTFMKYDDSTNMVSQKLLNVSGSSIYMVAAAEPAKLLVKREFHYSLDTATHKFRSDNRPFEESVTNLIFAYKKSYSDDQIFDKKSALISIGNLPVPDTSKKYNNAKEKKAGFSISLPPSGWSTEKDIFISNQLKKPMKGTQYSNAAQGAKFMVIEIPYSDQAENYINYTLDQSAAKNYLMRFSEKIPFKRNYLLFFECTCSNRRFLLIFDVLQKSYDKYNNTDYKQIINSFSIDC